MTSPNRRLLKQHSQRGLSLIELMISIFLGMLLIGSAFSMMSNLTQSGRVQTGLMEIQSDARFIMDVFTREVRKAGYRYDIFMNGSESFPSDNPRGLARGSAISGDQTELTFRFYGSGAEDTGPQGNIRDCLGNEVFKDELVVQRIYLDKGNLICQRFLRGKRSESISMASGLTAVDFLYGIETNGDGYADLYKPATANGDTVVSVRMNIELIAEQFLLDTSDTGGQRGPRLQTNLTRQYSQLVFLRNMVR